MREETEFRPKPMVEIGGLPLLWHIMKGYGEHGLNEFVCCLGYRGDMIKRCFLDYRAMGSDMTVDTGSGTVSYSRRNLEDWRVTLVDTGAETMTGGRVKRVAAHVRDGDRHLPVHLRRRRGRRRHRPAGATSTARTARWRPSPACIPPSRFGELQRRRHAGRPRFAEKPTGEGLISGGFFVFDVRVLDRLPDDPACVLEREPLELLAADGQLHVYRHDGFWQCADTVRDVELLRSPVGSRRRAVADLERHRRRRRRSWPTLRAA